MQRVGFLYSLYVGALLTMNNQQSWSTIQPPFPSTLPLHFPPPPPLHRNSVYLVWAGVHIDSLPCLSSEKFDIYFLVKYRRSDLSCYRRRRRAPPRDCWFYLWIEILKIFLRTWQLHFTTNTTTITTIFLFLSLNSTICLFIYLSIHLSFLISLKRFLYLLLVISQLRDLNINNFYTLS